MDNQLKAWLDLEMDDFSGVFKKMKRKTMSKVPLWMALCIIGMVALGYLVGADTAYVLRLHFPVGCGIALFVGLCYWLTGLSTSMKKVRKSYEREVNRFFTEESDKEAFLQQMESGNYETIDFMNTSSDNYPSRFIAGKDYWMYFKELSCYIIKASDVKGLMGREVTTRVSSNAGSMRIRGNVTIGYHLIIEYKEGAQSAHEQKEEKLYLENRKQYEQIVALIKKHCADNAPFTYN